MGEEKLKVKRGVKAITQSIGVETNGSRFNVYYFVRQLLIVTVDMFISDSIWHWQDPQSRFLTPLLAPQPPHDRNADLPVHVHSPQWPFVHPALVM